MKMSITGALLMAIVVCQTIWGQTAEKAKKPNYAVVNIKAGSGVTDGECELITDRIRTELFKTKMVNVMERTQMQDILKEQGFQQSGLCTDEACLVEMGQMLGVQTLVIGSLGKLGSMFMINIRAIDVRTAKVVKVVSVDIRGGIEALVEHLESIAGQLVSSGDEEKIKVKESKVEEVVTEPEPSIEEPKIAESVLMSVESDVKESEEPKDVPATVKLDNRAEKNRNRAGLGVTLELYGPPRHSIQGFDEGMIWIQFSEFDGITFIEDEQQNDPFISNLVLRFFLKAGPFLNISVGPGIMFGYEEYKSTIYDQYGYVLDEKILEITYSAPSINTGLTFVKRWHPLKINVGFMLNVVFPITNYYYSDYTVYDMNETDVDISATIGARTGVEILAGKHVGFSIDFLFQRLRYETKFNFDERDLLGMNPNIYTQEIIFSSVSLGFGVNFYF